MLLLNKLNLNRLALILSFLLPMILYLFTLMPGLGWGDSAYLALAVFNKKFEFFARSGHAVYVLTGEWFNRLFFIQPDLTYNLNLLSAVYGCLALLVFYFTLLKLTGSPGTGLLTALILAGSHTFWFLSVIADSYSLFALTTILQIYLLLCLKDSQKFYYFILLLLAMAIGFFNHMLTALFAPFFIILAYLWFSKKRKITYVLLLTGLAGSIFLFFTAAGTDSIRLFFRGIQEVYQRYFRLDRIFHELLFYPLKLWYQFPLAIILAITGFNKIWKTNRWLCLFLSLINLSVILFAACYQHPARAFNLLIISFTITALFIGAGWNEWRRRFKPLVRTAIAFLLIISSPICYYALPRIADTYGIRIAPSDWTVPHNGSNLYFMQPYKKDDNSPAKFATHVLNKVSGDDLLMGDEFSFGPVWYYYHTRNATVSPVSPAGGKGEFINPKKYYLNILIPQVFFERRLSKTEIWTIIKQSIEQKLSDGRKVYLLQPADLIFFTTEGPFDVTNLIKYDYEIVPNGLIYEIKLKGK